MIDEKCIFRTYSAGVHFGKLVYRDNKECMVKNAIRIWYWDGAASLSQLAMEGVKKPDQCKFAMPVSEILLTEVIEIIPCTDAAIENIESVPSWKV